MNRDCMVVENTRSRVKIISKLTNFKINHKLRGILVNEGRIHKELEKFFIIS